MKKLIGLTITIIVAAFVGAMGFGAVIAAVQDRKSRQGGDGVTDLGFDVTGDGLDGAELFEGPALPWHRYRHESAEEG